MTDEYFYDAADMLRELISKPSHSREEADAAEVVEKYIRDAGFEPQRHGNNVWTVAPDYLPGRPTLLLNAHIDTVKPAAGWTYDPYTPTEEEDMLYGLGSNDDGASVVSLFAAFRVVSQLERNYNLIFLASCEEEVSGKNGIESVLPLLGKIDFAIVGEPTGMNPAVAERGLMVLDGVIRGVSGHVAKGGGVNAIYQALPVIEKLKNLKFEKVSETLGPVAINVTQIESGTAHNVVPDLCRIVVDVRTTDAYTNEETLQMIKDAVPECELKERSTRLRPSGIATSHPVVQAAMMLGKEPYGSPTMSDQALMSFPSVKMGPGESSRSHIADEFIRWSEIREAIEIYIRILSRLKL